MMGIAIAKTPQLEPVAKEISAIVKKVTTGKINGVIQGDTWSITNLGNPN